MRPLKPRSQLGQLPLIAFSIAGSCRLPGQQEYPLPLYKDLEEGFRDPFLPGGEMVVSSLSWDTCHGKDQESLRSFEARESGCTGNPAVFLPKFRQRWREEKLGLPLGSSSPKKEGTWHLAGVTWPLGGFSETLED